MFGYILKQAKKNRLMQEFIRYKKQKLKIKHQNRVKSNKHDTANKKD